MVFEIGQAGKKLKYNLDEFSPKQIVGWVCDSVNNETVKLELFVNFVCVGEFRADMHRSDLQIIRPDGAMAFRISPFGSEPWEQYVPANAQVELREKLSGLILAHTIWNGSAPSTQHGVIHPSGAKMRLNKGLFVIPLSERDSGWRQELLKTASRITTDSRSNGFDVCASYGTLLGAVRQGAMIEHDDDVDLMFISSTGALLNAVEDFQRFQHFLVSNGYSIDELSNGQIHVRIGHSFAVDIFLAWIEQGKLSLTFTVRSGVSEEDVFPFGNVKIEGVLLPSPRSPEALLEKIYGPGWKVPDPSFVWNISDELSEYFAPIHNYGRGANSDYWTSYYADSNKVSPPQTPSQFALFALAVQDTPSLIIDLGCGNGRDTLFFASQGVMTLGLDYTHEIIEINKATANKRGLSSNAHFLQIDLSVISNLNQVLNLLDRLRTTGPICVYSRFFFHAVDEHTEGAALLLVSEILQRTGDYAVFEFRTLQDAERQKITPEHYRRYINVDKFVHSASLNYKLNCIYRTEGLGYAVYRNDDAHVARLIFEKQIF